MVPLLGAGHDSGGNFGRLSRYGIMDDYIRSMLSENIRGIPVMRWVDFFVETNLGKGSAP